MAELKITINDDFITLFEDQPCLWDTKSKDYRDRVKRSIALETMLCHLNVPITDQHLKCLKAKIKQLRTSFAKELRLQSSSCKSGAGVLDIHTPKWKFFSRLAFLKPHYSTRACRNNLETSDSLQAPSQQTIDTKDDIQLPMVDVNQMPSTSTPLLDVEVSQMPNTSWVNLEETESESSQSPCTPLSNKNKSKSRQRESALEACQSLLTDFAQRRSQKSDRNERLYHFSLCLYEKLRSLPTPKALMAMNKIDNLIFEMEMDNCTDE